MFRLAEERIHNHSTVREMFYNIPSIKNTIAARQMNFIGKVVRSSFKCPAKQLLTACCEHKIRRGQPQMHLKDSIVKNLCLLFKRIPEVRIHPLNGATKYWIKEAKDAKHWKQLTACLLDPTSPLPDRPTDWNRRRTSGRQRARTSNTSNNSAPPSPPPSPQQRQKSRVPPRQ